MVLMTEELDELDLRLLDALQRNARSTFTELGAVVGLKPPAVHDRVKRLEQRGYIRGYSAQLDPNRLGLHLTAFVSCYTSPDCAYDEFTRRLSEMPEICEVHSVAGEETFLCKVMTRSTQHLDELLARLKAMPGMARTRTTVVLSVPFERGRGNGTVSARTGLRAPGHPLGIHRVIEPEGAMPQQAWRLDNTPAAADNEILCEVEALNIDSASFKQIAEECGFDPQRIGEHIVEDRRASAASSTIR